MLVKDQIAVRMDQLGIPVNELAKRLAVSPQSVRHWLAGRSFPGKSKTVALEQALSFKLDFSEGLSSKPTVDSTLQQVDIQTFLAISKLLPEVKGLFSRLATAFSEIKESSAQPFSSRVAVRPASAFRSKGNNAPAAIKKSPSRPARKKAG